jgi:hypothetical protein
MSHAGQMSASVNCIDCVDIDVREFVAQLIGTCHAKHTDHIMIAGRRAIQAVIDLCRRGYLNVMCRSSAPGPHVADDSADSLWILNVPSETELRALVAKFGRDLRMGGMLVVGFEIPISSDHASRLRKVLLGEGFTPLRQQTDSSGRTLLICGRHEPHPYAQAA